MNEELRMKNGELGSEKLRKEIVEHHLPDKHRTCADASRVVGCDKGVRNAFSCLRRVAKDALAPVDCALLVLRENKFVIGVFHLAKIDHAVAPVDKHIYLRFCVEQLTSAAPGIDIRADAGNAKRPLNLRNMPETKHLEGESAPSVHDGFAVVVLPEVLARIGSVIEKFVVKKQEGIYQLIDGALFLFADNRVSANKATFLKFFKAGGNLLARKSIQSLSQIFPSQPFFVTGQGVYDVDMDICFSKKRRHKAPVLAFQSWAFSKEELIYILRNTKARSEQTPIIWNTAQSHIIFCELISRKRKVPPFCILFALLQSKRFDGDRLRHSIVESASIPKDFVDYPGRGRAANYKHDILSHTSPAVPEMLKRSKKSGSWRVEPWRLIDKDDLAWRIRCFQHPRKLVESLAPACEARTFLTAKLRNRLAKVSQLVFNTCVFRSRMQEGKTTAKHLIYEKCLADPSSAIYCHKLRFLRIIGLLQQFDFFSSSNHLIPPCVAYYIKNLRFGQVGKRKLFIIVQIVFANRHLDNYKRYLRKKHDCITLSPIFDEIKTDNKAIALNSTRSTRLNANEELRMKNGELRRAA